MIPNRWRYIPPRFAERIAHGRRAQSASQQGAANAARELVQFAIGKFPQRTLAAEIDDGELVESPFRSIKSPRFSNRRIDP